MSKTTYPVPRIIMFDKIGSSELGYISIAETQRNVPFDFKRIYWTYFTPQDVVRGGHAHKDIQQMIFAMSGIITFNTEDCRGNKETFILDHPAKGLYTPNLVWGDIHFTHSAVMLCLASEYYNEEEYIRDYKEFKSCIHEI